jgi:amino acid transporter
MSNKGEKKGIGTFDYFCIGFGSIVGVGWAVSLNKWMAGSGGPLPASFGYILALIMMVPVALCYCELAPMMPVAGGGMAYAYKAFNQNIGFISGWAAFGAFLTIIPWEAIYVVDILSVLFPAIKGPVLYTFFNSDIFLGQIICGTLFSVIIFAVNLKGAASSASVQRGLTIFLVIVGLLAIIMGLVKFDSANFQPIYENVGKGTHNGFMGGALAILASAPFFLAGFETIPQMIEDGGDDTTSIGKTVILAVGIACIFYALLLFALGSAMPWQEFYKLPTPAASNMFKVIYAGGLGNALYLIVLVGAIAGLFTTWNGFFMASPRLLQGMARGYMVPQAFAKEHPKYGTPINGLIFCLVLSVSGAFLGYGLINPLTSFSAAGFVLSWLITSFSVVSLRKREPDAHRPYKVPGGSATAWFAGIVMTVLFVLLFIPNNPVYMGKTASIVFVGWMVIGIILYVSVAGKRNAVSAEERERVIFAKAEK